MKLLAEFGFVVVAQFPGFRKTLGYRYETPGGVWKWFFGICSQGSRANPGLRI